MTRYERIAAALLAGTIVASATFAIVYALGAQTQAAAAALAAAFGTLAAAMVVFEHRVMARRESIEERAPLPSGAASDAAATDALLCGAREVVGRRAWLVKLFAGAVAALGIAALVPLGSLVPPGVSRGQLGRTSWRKGSRLVHEDGTPVRASDLEENSVLTVFPEGNIGAASVNAMARDATVLVRVPPQELRLAPGRADWAPDGLVAFSKVCTHAGCPVALYRAAARQLFCPCHQSTFDVLAGGARIFGPAARALPQLPIAIATDGTLYARDAYPEPIGPSTWERA